MPASEPSQPEPGEDLVIRVPAATADAAATQHQQDQNQEQEAGDGVD